MAQRTAAELKAFADANIASNGSNAITGDLHNQMLTDIIDSMVNKSSDSLLIVGNVYRSAEVAVVKDVEKQITFSTALANNLYDVVISDTEGLGFDNITDKQTTGFKITPFGTGNLIYFIILSN